MRETSRLSPGPRPLVPRLMWRSGLADRVNSRDELIVWASRVFNRVARSAFGFHLASNRDSLSPSKNASLPGIHDGIVPIPLPVTSASAASSSNSRPSRFGSSEIAQQVRPAPLDLSDREILAIPWACLSHRPDLGSAFHGTEVANLLSNHPKCASSRVNFARFLGLDKNERNRSCFVRTTKALTVAASCAFA